MFGHKQYNAIVVLRKKLKYVWTDDSFLLRCVTHKHGHDIKMGDWISESWAEEISSSIFYNGTLFMDSITVLFN